MPRNLLHGPLPLPPTPPHLTPPPPPAPTYCKTSPTQWHTCVTPETPCIQTIIYLKKLPEVRIIMRGTYFLQWSIFFRMYLPLALEVYNRLFTDSFGFIVVNKIKKHPSGLTQSQYSPWTSILIEPGGWSENWRPRQFFFFTLFTPTARCFYHIILRNTEGAVWGSQYSPRLLYWPRPIGCLSV